MCRLRVGLPAPDGRLYLETPLQSSSRQWERLPLALPIVVRGTDQYGHRILDFTTALNICAGGVLLASRRYLPPGSRLSLEIPASPLPALPETEQAVRMLAGNVLRATPYMEGHLLAIEFTPPIPLGQPRDRSD